MCSFCAEYCCVVSVLGSVLMFGLMVTVASETPYFPTAYPSKDTRKEAVLTLFLASLVPISSSSLVLRRRGSRCLSQGQEEEGRPECPGQARALPHGERRLEADRVNI